MIANLRAPGEHLLVITSANEGSMCHLGLNKVDKLLIRKEWHLPFSLKMIQCFRHCSLSRSNKYFEKNEKMPMHKHKEKK